MRVLGIDCGTEYTGYGVVEQHADGRLVFVVAGAIHLPKRETMPKRLSTVFTELSHLIYATTPKMVAIEEVFYSVNAKSALKLGQVRGVAMLAASSAVQTLRTLSERMLLTGTFSSTTGTVRSL